MASSLMSFHIASDTESFSTAVMLTFEWLLAGMTVAVDSQAAGSREGLVALLTDVSILRWWKGRL
jgi:hypothetical protein